MSSPLDSILYKATHVNHPSSKWVRESLNHYFWLVEHTDALLREYTRRFEKIHGCSRVFHFLKTPPLNIPNGHFNAPPKCMDEAFIQDDPVMSYRAYYISKKRNFKMEWKGRSVPEWICA